MDGIEQLRRQALLRRNATILQAKREYYAALKEIKALNRKLGVRLPGRPRKVDASDYSGLRPSAATSVTSALCAVQLSLTKPAARSATCG